MENQTEAKGKQQLTNGNSQTSPTSGTANQVLNMGQTAMVGNRTRSTKHRIKVSKLIRLQGLHHPTKEMRLDVSTLMLSSDQN